MKHKHLKSVLALAVCSAIAGPAVAETSITGSVRIGGLFDDSTGNDDLSIRNFGSRFIMSASEEIGEGLTGIGRVEVGINPNTTSGSREFGGFDRTRQVWGGIQGGFGTVKIGAQYTAFYDMVTGKGDVAWWGSCFLEEECARVPAVLKYSGGSGPITYAASIQADSGDEGNDVADDLELGATYDAGSFTLGAGVTARADDGADEGGTLVGIAATGALGDANLSAVFQVADQEFVNDTDDHTIVTVTAWYKNMYGLFTSRDQSTNTPTSMTLGYQWDIADKTLMYFELQQLDPDEAGVDSNTIGRMVLKRDFNVFGS